MTREKGYTHQFNQSGYKSTVSENLLHTRPYSIRMGEKDTAQSKKEAAKNKNKCKS
jgi:hypothetical protein